MTINRSMGFPGGWRLPVSPNVTITGETFQLLRDRVFEWRLANSVEPGNIEAEIDAFCCSLHPERCSPEPKDSQFPAGVSPDDRMADRVLRWVAPMIDVRRMPQGGWSLVSLKTAEARAAACASCHRNVAFDSNCSGCDRSVVAAGARAASHRANPLPHTLRACSLFGWLNGSACHLTNEALSVPPDDPRRKLAPQICPWASLPANVADHSP